MTAHPPCLSHSSHVLAMSAMSLWLDQFISAAIHPDPHAVRRRDPD
jgi:hypothetical protein